jgi:ribulose-bisphosphate carboxylase small chain
MAAIAACPVKAASAAKVAAVQPRAMQVWRPIDNKKYETLSFLPPLTDAEVAKQVEYCVASGWTPCIEFECEKGFVYRGEDVMTAQPCHYDGRYWVMWKLPMFGCTDARQVLEEVRACTTEYPNAFVRVIGFDSTRQVQCLSFIVHKPGMAPRGGSAGGYTPPPPQQNAGYSW